MGFKMRDLTIREVFGITVAVVVGMGLVGLRNRIRELERGEDVLKPRVYFLEREVRALRKLMKERTVEVNGDTGKVRVLEDGHSYRCVDGRWYWESEKGLVPLKLP